MKPNETPVPVCATNPWFDQWLLELGDLHDRKNAGYAGEVDGDPLHNFRQAEKFGIPMYKGIAVRLSDKFSRFYSLMRNADNEKVGESIEDLMDDIAVYSGLFKQAYQAHMRSEKRP